VGDLGLERAASLGRHGLQRGAELGRDRSSDRPLGERRLGEQDALAPFAREQVERHLRAQHSTAEIHQHEHSVTLIGPLDRLRHANRVRSERGLRSFDPARQLDWNLAAHPPRQLRNPGGERRAVRDDHETDHRLSGRAGSSEPVRAVEELDRVDGVDARAVLDLPPARFTVARGDVALGLPQSCE
jgi:hypothetical protein